MRYEKVPGIYVSIEKPLGKHLISTLTTKDNEPLYPDEDMIVRGGLWEPVYVLREDAAEQPTGDAETVPRDGYDYPTTAEVLAGGQRKGQGASSPWSNQRETRNDRA